MRVFVAGAAGALGAPLVRGLVAQGYQVFGLTRSPAKRQTLEDLGAAPVIADALDASRLENAVRKVAPTHVVHMLTALPPNGPLRLADVTATNILRTTGTANLLRVSIAAGVKRILGESFVAVYGYGDIADRPQTETDPLQAPERSRGLQSVVDALRSLESQLLTAHRQGQIDAIVLRYGLVYGPDISSTQAMGHMLQQRRLPTMRGVQGLYAFVHSADATSATLAALESVYTGEIYNLVDDEPVGMNEFFRHWARVLDAPSPIALPRWLLQLAAPVAAAMFATRLPVSNAKAKRGLGWRLKFPTYREGLDDCRT